MRKSIGSLNTTCHLCVQRRYWRGCNYQGEIYGVHTGVEPTIYWKSPPNTAEFIEIWWNNLVCVCVCMWQPSLTMDGCFHSLCVFYYLNKWVRQRVWLVMHLTSYVIMYLCLDFSRRNIRHERTHTPHLKSDSYLESARAIKGCWEISEGFRRRVALNGMLKMWLFWVWPNNSYLIDTLWHNCCCFCPAGGAQMVVKRFTWQFLLSEGWARPRGAKTR